MASHPVAQMPTWSLAILNLIAWLQQNSLGFSIVMFRVFPVSCGPWEPAKGAPMSSWSHRDFKQVLAVIILNSMYSSGPTVESWDHQALSPTFFYWEIQLDTTISQWVFHSCRGVLIIQTCQSSIGLVCSLLKTDHCNLNPTWRHYFRSLFLYSIF